MIKATFIKSHKIPILFTVLCVALYVSFGYDLMRTDHTKLLTLYAALFFLFYKLVQNTTTDFRLLVGISILFRLVLLFATPNLSQDFYRFIWDGRLLLGGWNPYLFTPESFISLGKFPISQAEILHKGMGSLNASHYTNYPPIKQLIFLIAGLLSGKSILGSIIVFRSFIIAADVGIFIIGVKLLKRFNLPLHHIFWYLLNPFIIIELTGNLHFEGIMLFFLLWSIYLLDLNKWKSAAVIYALSIAVKLVPLLFLPLFFNYFRKARTKLQMSSEINSRRFIKSIGFSKLIAFYSIIAVVTLGLFLPFFSIEFITNYSKTVALWFNAFEFNGSMYAIARAIGYQLTGYNQIALIGKFIPPLTIMVVVALAIFKNNSTTKSLLISMLFAATLYYFISTTVHPWYLASLLILSIFTNYKFPLVWSFMIILSYVGYASTNHTENLWLTGLQYAVVYGVFIWEVFIKKDHQKVVSQNFEIRL